MSLDTAIARTLQKTIQRTGTPVMLRRITPGVYNTATRTVGNSVEDHAVTMAITIYSDRETLAGAGSIQSGDRKALLAARDVTFAPLPKDQVLIDDLPYDVMSVDQEGLNAAAMYVLQLRR
ncbi:MAG TPA: hypothetical protein VF910_01005 [Candidatus Bathyarchaeia archaeon]